MAVQYVCDICGKTIPSGTYELFCAANLKSKYATAYITPDSIFGDGTFMKLDVCTDCKPSLINGINTLVEKCKHEKRC